MDLAKRIACELVRQLKPEDHLAIIAYASSAELVRKLMPVSDVESIERDVNNINGEGTTKFEAGK